jgi:signal transduction histidine kinase
MMSTRDYSDYGKLPASHEARRPLTYLVACLDWIRHQLALHPDDRSLDAARDWITQAGAGVEHIAELLNDEEPLPPSPTCELASLTQATLRLVAPELQRRAQLSLSLSEAEVAIDPARARRLLINLLVNAMVFLPGDGERRRMSVSLRRTPGVAVLELRHEGKLAFETELAAVSAPFFTTDGGALTIGWAVCRRIVHACGGSLVVERDSFGTRAQLTLPLAR